MRFDIRSGAIQPGDSGSQAIDPGRAEKSQLIRRVESRQAEERMPPDSDPLTPQQIRILRAWINQGANWPAELENSNSERKELSITSTDRQYWSFQPLRRVPVSLVNDLSGNDVAWCQTEIDRFIWSALQSKSLRPNPIADRRTLIRRAYCDLIGLPPSPDEVQRFVADSSPDAYQHLVEQLLASPHYGERWRRHWLDLTRYADSDGLETDADRPTAYHYRDFVIRSLNDDLSFHTFVRWQLAGGEYDPDDPRALAATGFLTTAPNEVLMVPMEEERIRLRYNELDGTAVTMTAAFLGLTIGCARCHDHKFDAIPTRDYYRIQSALMSTVRGEVPLASRAQLAQHRQEEASWSQKWKPVQQQFSTWLAQQKQTHQASLLREKIKALAISEENKSLLLDQPGSEVAKKLARSLSRELRLTDANFRRAFTDEQRRQWDEYERRLAEIEHTRPKAIPTALAITEKGSDPEPAWLLARGDFYARAERVELGFLSVLTNSRTPTAYWTAARFDSSEVGSTRQRRALADWMTDTEQGAGALLARVIVNRVWQFHFGEGLSRTLNDFGVRGERPTHPELLKWLTSRFVSDGWSLKTLHREIVSSAVYMQDASDDVDRSKIDPEIRLLWRRRPRRLEAEVLRDSILSVSSGLNKLPFGPAFKPPIPPEAVVARNTKSPYPTDASDTPATRRRSIYMSHKRVVHHPFMQVFDGPDASISCGRRNNTTVAPQAMALLNDPFVRARAEDFANVLWSTGDQDPSNWIVLSFRTALAREPSSSELDFSLEFLQQQFDRRTILNGTVTSAEVRRQALADFCQALFASNEFIYVD